MTKNRIFVTGGAGFIGTAVVSRLLSSGFQVTVYDNFLAGSCDYLDRRARVIRGDIDRFDLLSKALFGHDYVIHLAARPFIPDSFAQPSLVRRTNFNGTVNVFMAARAHKAKLIHISTAEVYGTANCKPMDESHAKEPTSPYAHSKLEAESYLLKHFRTHTSGLIILRLFNAFGPRETHPYVIPEIIRQVVKEDQIELGRLDTWRDFTYVEDVAEAIVKPIEHERFGGEIVNIGSGIHRQIRQVLDKICEITHARAKPIRQDETRLRGDSEVRELVADNRLAKDLLGWTPRTDFDNALRRTVEWYMSNDALWPYEKKMTTRSCSSMTAPANRSADRINPLQPMGG